ncbi:MAG: glycosyltransferase family 2 protein [Bacteroidales bacterium]|nr:MAG: glycosyltransferase family 2 protein [Bacteroidales bacterium]
MSATKANPHLSIVIPLYNEENNLEELYEELVAVLKTMGKSYEIVFIDDGSRDKSFEIVRKLYNHDKRITGLSLSRNFGHQVALVAGMEYASGDVVVMMDADFQHPPELITLLYQKYSEGFDIVNTRRVETEGIRIFKRLTSWLYYKLINFLSDMKIEASSSDFRLMNRRSVDAFLRFQERNRFNRGLITWMGFKQEIVEYKAPTRLRGRSKYTLRKMMSLGLDGITSFSSKPLRISFYTGLFIFLAGIAYAVFAIINHFRGMNIPGWTSTILIILLVGGFQLLSLGIIGEYIARIYSESKSRPIYFLKDKTGNENEN